MGPSESIDRKKRVYIDTTPYIVWEKVVFIGFGRKKSFDGKQRVFSGGGKKSSMENEVFLGGERILI